MCDRPMSGEKEGEGALGVGAAGVQVEPHSLCILVADHDKEDRSRMKAQLEHVGFFVHECVCVCVPVPLECVFCRVC